MRNQLKKFISKVTYVPNKCSIILTPELKSKKHIQTQKFDNYILHTDHKAYKHTGPIVSVVGSPINYILVAKSFTKYVENLPEVQKCFGLKYSLKLLKKLKRSCFTEW